MPTFLFWNLNRKRLEETLASLARRYEIDVLMLVECSIDPVELLTILNPIGSPDYHYAPGFACDAVEIYTRFPSDYIQPTFETARLTIRRLNLPGLVDILLAVNHFPSKVHWDEDSQAAESTELASSIALAEEGVGHSRTVLVGDLNMNPFESGVVSANGLHGVMSRRIAKEGSRVVQAKEYPFFYNPMWSLLGDASPGPPGTYYFRKAVHKVFFWNTFDQVLIRPELLASFSNKDLEVLVAEGTNSFLDSNGRPDSKEFSDHLPLLFKLAL